MHKATRADCSSQRAYNCCCTYTLLRLLLLLLMMCVVVQATPATHC